MPQLGEEAPVTAEKAGQPLAHNSPTLAADPTEPRFVALASRVDNPDFSCMLHLSGDRGRSWVPSTPLPKLPAGADKCYAPEVAFDRNGLLYFMFVGLSGLGNHPTGVFLATSADRGRTFSAPRNVLGPRVYMPRMALDPEYGRQGRIHLVWVHARAAPTTGGFPPTDNPILAAHSDDGGRSFSKPVRVSDKSRRRAVAPAPAVGRSGSIHVAYYDLGDDARDYEGLEGPAWDGTWSLIVATSADRGASFGRGAVVDGGLIPPERIMVIFTTPPPALVADGKARLWAGWWDARNGDWDVFVRRSLDGGRSWGPTLRVNDDRRGNGRHQYLPQLAIAPGGRLDAIFYDRRSDDENLRNHVSYASWHDGARGFSSNRRLTSEASDSRIGPTFESLASSAGLYELGGRLGLLARRDGAVAAWADTRNGEVGFIRQDVVTASVSLPRQRNGSGWERIVLPALLCVLFFGGGWVRARVRRGRAQRHVRFALTGFPAERLPERE
ncbi:MAG TPA: sialidase family protein [Acidimicrobiales bacterium]|nr:sialidase family protein [Acidimicrobiales bacterium]